MPLDPVESAARAAFKPQDLRTAWEWCEDHIVVDNTSFAPGRWHSAISPWVREPMEVATDKRVTMIVVRCSAQSSKTQMILNLICYDAVEDPGPEMYVMANKEDAEEFVRDRFGPTLENCKPANELLLRGSKLNFTFKTMPLYFVGAGSPAKLQGKPIKRLKLDEVRNYPPGALNTVLKRVRAFSALAQVFIVSTPDKKKDVLDLAFEQGDQRTPHFPCPSCGHIQQLRFAQLKWDTNEKTRPDGKWNFDELANTIRFECENEKCKYPIRDTPSERKLICRTSRYIRMNPNAPVHHVSFTWNALLPWWVSWRSIAEEFLNARISARHGDINPMKTFINETLGESWEDSLGVIQDFGFLEARKDVYEYGEKWSEGARKFMAADKQESGGEHYWYVIREFAQGGKSRLLGNGRANTKPELEEIRKTYGVPALNSIVDSGYEAQDVYRFCMATGWKAFKGDDTQFYIVPRTDPRDPNKMILVRQIWRKTVAVVYNAQTRMRIGNLPLYTFASGPTKELLMEYMKGLVGAWTIPKETELEYMKQVCGERREAVADPKGAIHFIWKRTGPNHFFDCEQMILIGAIISKTISAPMRVVRGASDVAHRVSDKP
jgi:hypothetical protein